MPTPQLGVVATPVTGGGTRSAAGDELAQAAEALAGFNPTLRQIAEKRKAKEDDDAKAKGTFDAFKKATTYRDAVNAGTLEQGDNPFFKQARKEQIGRNTAYAIAGIVRQEYAKWPGRTSEDPDGEAAQEFVASIIEKQTEGIEDAQVIAGLEPILQQSVANFLQETRAEQVKNLEAGYRDGVSLDLGLQIERLNLEGNLDASSWNAVLDEARSEANLLAIPNAEFDELVFQAVSNRAQLTLDASLFNLLDIPRSDGTPPISSKPAYQKLIADGRDGTFRNEWQVISRMERQKTEQKERDKEEIEKSILAAVYGTADQPPTGVTPELKQLAADKLGFEVSNRLFSAVESVTTDALTGFESEDDLDRANAAVQAGDAAMIRQMIFDKRIPPRQRLSYLNQVDAQIVQFASQGRAEASADRAAKGGATKTKAQLEAEETERLIEEARLRRLGTTPDAEKGRKKLTAITTSHPELAADIEANRPTAIYSALGAMVKDLGPDATREAFDAKYGPGAYDLMTQE